MNDNQKATSYSVRYHICNVPIPIQIIQDLDLEIDLRGEEGAPVMTIMTIG